MEARNREKMLQHSKELIKETIIHLHSNGIYPGIKPVERHVDLFLIKNTWI